MIVDHLKPGNVGQFVPQLSIAGSTVDVPRTDIVSVDMKRLIFGMSSLGSSHHSSTHRAKQSRRRADSIITSDQLMIIQRKFKH